MPPIRNTSGSTVFFKALAGAGAGAAGTVLLLIFVLIGLGATTGKNHGPFFGFVLLLMGLLTSLITNTLATYLFMLVDHERYGQNLGVLRHIASLNIFVFLFFLPIYLSMLAFNQDAQSLFLVVALQLVLAAQASMFALENASAAELRDRWLATYGITLGVVVSLVLNALIYLLFTLLTHTNVAEGAVVTSQGATALLFAILPITWLSLGLVTALTEKIYRWIVLTWGNDFLNSPD